MTYLKLLLYYFWLKIRLEFTPGVISVTFDAPIFCDIYWLKQKIEIVELVIANDLDGLDKLGLERDIKFI